MRIEEIEEILGRLRLLPKPAHILLTDESIYQEVDGSILYRGVTPTWRGNVIVLGRDVNPRTVIHESLHSVGFGENLTEILDGIILRLADMRGLMGLPLRKVKYELCPGCEGFKTLHDKYSQRIEHYRRMGE